MKILSSFGGMSKRAVQVQINIDKYSYELHTSIFVTVSFTNIRNPKVGMGRIPGISHGIPQAISFIFSYFFTLPIHLIPHHLYLGTVRYPPPTWPTASAAPVNFTAIFSPNSWGASTASCRSFAARTTPWCAATSTARSAGAASGSAINPNLIKN